MKEKIRILFVCHGNICRSPMAEFIMRDLAEKHGLADAVEVASAATSAEELGNPVHRGTARILAMLGIDCSEKRARKMQRSDYEAYDYLIGMDRMNVANMNYILGGDKQCKICRLLDLGVNPRDIRTLGTPGILKPPTGMCWRAAKRSSSALNGTLSVSLPSCMQCVSIIAERFFEQIKKQSFSRLLFCCLCQASWETYMFGPMGKGR